MYLIHNKAAKNSPTERNFLPKRSDTDLELNEKRAQREVGLNGRDGGYCRW